MIRVGKALDEDDVVSGESATVCNRFKGGERTVSFHLFLSAAAHLSQDVGQ